MIGTAKSVFVDTWPGGYIESFNGGKPGEEALVVEHCLVPFYDKKKVALEIGCGGGLWITKYLLNNFAHVIALDVIPKPAALKGTSVTYIELPDDSCNGVGITECIDFIWSFGCFCHLPGQTIREYLRSIYRMLQPDGVAVIMFGNWMRKGHPQQDESTADIREHGEGTIWFYCDAVLAEKWCHEAGFTVKDLMPDYIHTVLHLSK